MIDSAKYKYLIIELIAILIATPHLSAQGLQFFGNKVPIEQRTSYTIFSKKQRSEEHTSELQSLQ